MQDLYSSVKIKSDKKNIANSLLEKTEGGLRAALCPRGKKNSVHSVFQFYDLF